MNTRTAQELSTKFIKIYDALVNTTTREEFYKVWEERRLDINHIKKFSSMHYDVLRMVFRIYYVRT